MVGCHVMCMVVVFQMGDGHHQMGQVGGRVHELFGTEKAVLPNLRT
jgi:hypothetical protein